MLKKPTPTLIPGIPPIPTDASPSLRAYLTALGEALQVRLGRRGDPRDRAVTLRELIDSGLAKELKTSQYNPNADNSSGTGFGPELAPNLSVPPAPSGLQGSAGFKTIILQWNSATWPGYVYGNHSQTHVFRHTSDAIGDAVYLGSSNSGMYADDTVGYKNAATVTLANNPFTTGSSGSNAVITVTASAHGAITGDFVTFSGGTATDGVTAIQLNIKFEITKVNNDSYTITTAGTASSGSTAGGGSAVVAAYDLTASRTYYYWVRYISTDNVEGPFNATSGTAVVATNTNAITHIDIAIGAVKAPNLGPLSVLEANLAANSVTVNKVANNAIVAGKIAAGTIVAADIASGTITATQITAGTIDANTIATNAITAIKIQADAVEAGKIKANAVIAGKIAANAVTTGTIAANAVTAAKIAVGAITADKAIIANAAIVTAQIADANITTAKIASAAITTAKIADANITTAKIGSAAVDTLRIGGNAATVPQYAVGSLNNVAVSNGTYSSAIVSTNFTFSGLNSRRKCWGYYLSKSATRG